MPDESIANNAQSYETPAAPAPVGLPPEQVHAWLEHVQDDLRHEVPAPGTALLVDGVKVGEVTSSTWSPALAQSIALGYVKRDYTQPGMLLQTADGGSAAVCAWYPDRSHWACSTMGFFPP